jgi:hypothetical protein
LITFFGFKLRKRKKLKNCNNNLHFHLYKTIKQTLPDILIPLSNHLDKISSNSNAITPDFTKLISQSPTISSSGNIELQNKAETLNNDTPGDNKPLEVNYRTSSKRPITVLTPSSSMTSRTKKLLRGPPASGKPSRGVNSQKTDLPALGIELPTLTRDIDMNFTNASDLEVGPSTSTTDLFTFMERKFRGYDQRFNQLESLVAENATLKKDLAAARAEIAELKRQVSSNISPSPSWGGKGTDSIREPGDFSFTLPGNSQLSLPSCGGTEASKWAPTGIKTGTPSSKLTFSQVAAIKVPAKKGKKKISLQSVKRYFESPRALPTPGSPEEPQYEYVYVPSKYRERISKFRAKLRRINIDSGRVLDVHYPARGVAAFLIHRGYSQEVHDILKKEQIMVVTDFDQFAATNVDNPTYASLDNQARVEKARELQQARLARGLKYIRSHVRGSIAHDFVLQGFLTLEQVKVLLAGGSLEDVPNEDDAMSEGDDIASSLGSMPLTGGGEPVNIE